MRSVSSSSELAVRSPWQPLIHLLWIAPLLVLAAPIGLGLWFKWTRSFYHNAHGMFVPVLVAVLAYYRLKNTYVEREEPSPWGFAILVPALFLISLDSVAKTEFLRAFALILTLPGFSLLLLGPRHTGALLFPFVLAFFMLPVPPLVLTQVHEALQLFTTAGTEWVLHLMNLPALAEGILLHLPHGTFRVAQTCSGYSALYAAVTVALVLAYLSRSWSRRILIVLVAAPIAMVGNVFRIVLLALLAEWRGFHILDTPMHVLSGYIAFVFTLAVLFLFGERKR